MPKGDKITLKQKRFVDKYLETGVKVTAALEAYDTDDYKTASAIAGENLEKPRVIEYLESQSQKSAERISQLRDQDQNLPVALSAAKDILDRAGYKAVDKQAVVGDLKLSWQ